MGKADFKAYASGAAVLKAQSHVRLGKGNVPASRRAPADGSMAQPGRQATCLPGGQARVKEGPLATVGGSDIAVNHQPVHIPVLLIGGCLGYLEFVRDGLQGDRCTVSGGKPHAARVSYRVDAAEMRDQGREACWRWLPGKRIREDNGQLGRQVPVVRHERPGQRGLDFKMIAEPLGEVLDSFGMSGTLRVTGPPGE